MCLDEVETILRRRKHLGAGMYADVLPADDVDA
jgi:hypothetical protein